MRVVSLLASGTEIVCALGAGESLVGRSHECDNPAWVRGLPACTRPAFDVSGSSRDIDAEVRRRVRASEPLYDVDADLIGELAPDLLITQVHCDVCAVTPADVNRAGYARRATQVIALGAGTVAGIHDDIRRIARALNLVDAGEALIAQMQRRIAAVTSAVGKQPVPTVLVLEWTDPTFASGNWTPELVTAAGGRAILAESGHSTAVSWDRVLDADPDCLVIAPCGFDLDRTAREVPVLEALPGWFRLTAVRTGRVALADGNRYFNRSGTTIVETTEMLAEILHGVRPERALEHEAWLRYERSDSGRRAPTHLRV
jgi:iron complex transport system substrate-binding protein